MGGICDEQTERTGGIRYSSSWVVSKYWSVKWLQFVERGEPAKTITCLQEWGERSRMGCSFPALVLLGFTWFYFAFAFAIPEKFGV